MKNFSLEIDADGVALVKFDAAAKSMNVISNEVQREFEELTGIIRSSENIRGVVLFSGKSNGFCAGADLKELYEGMAKWSKATSQDELREAIADGCSWSRRVRAIETCGKPVAVAINGLAMGGGLELALGCHYRIGAEDSGLRLAFPEAGVGLLPGAGGTQRLLRLLGVSAALPYLLDCTPIEISDALAGGILHAVVPAAEMIETARRWVLDNPAAVAPWDVKGFRVPNGGPHGVDGYRNFSPAIAARHAGGGDEFPAVANILKCVYEGAQVPIDAGLRIEARYFFSTARSPRAAAMVRTFFLSRQVLAKRAKRDAPQPLLDRLQRVVSAERDALIKAGAFPLVVENVGKLLTTVTEGSGSDMKPVPSGSEVERSSLAAIRERLLYIQALEAVRCLDDGSVSDAMETDAIAVGSGFPKWTGGPISFIEIEGLDKFISRSDQLANQFGESFCVPASLRERGSARRGFYD